MNTWQVDKFGEAIDFLTKSNTAQLEASAITTREEREQLDKHYTAISKVLLDAVKRHIIEADKSKGD